MSTYNPRRLCRPEVLRAIGSRLLEELLAPHAVHLAAQGIELPLRGREAPLKYLALAQLLIAPERGMPRELVDALYYIDELATPSGLEALESAARAAGIWTHQYLDVPSAAIVLQLWLCDRTLVERVHAQMAVSRLRSFEYFQPEKNQTPELPGSLPPRLRAMENELNDSFHQKRRGRYARVLADQRADGVWFYIGHGGLLRREATVDNAGASSICYRPEVYDAVVYIPATGELGVHTRSVWERMLYQRVFGRHLFGDERMFAGAAKYCLDPLLKDGQASLRCLDVPGLEWVRLAEITVLEPGHLPRFDSSKGDDLFGSWGTSHLQVSANARLVSAGLKFKLLDCAAPRWVRIRPSNRAHYSRDVDATWFEKWLMRRGFIRQRGESSHARTEAVLAVA